MVDDGLRQAQFSGGGEVFDFVPFFNGAHGCDAAAVLENNRVCRYPPARQEECSTQQKEADSIWTGRLPHFSIVIPCGPSDRLALFPHAESDYTSCMWVGGKVFTLWFLLSPAAFPATEKSPHELYDAINALRVDPSNVYQLSPSDRIELRRGDAAISFEEGALAFFFPLDGRVTGAVFSGHGHVLAAPRDPVEKQQMGRFLGAPVLDQVFVNAYIRFTDRTAEELLSQFRAANLAPQTNASVASEWHST